MKLKWQKAFMKSAEIFGQMSHALRAKVGAVIVKDNRIISIGYNGMPSGWTNDCEVIVGQDDVGDLKYKTKPEVLHAETNAIAKVARSSESCEGASIFTTYAPCLDCAKLIHQSGITTVYYSNEHMRTNEGVEFLQKCNIEVIHVSI